MIFDNLIRVARVSKTFGIKGEIVIKVNEEINLLSNLKNKKCFIKLKDNNFDYYLIETDNSYQNKRCLKFNEINNINDVTKFINHDIYFDKNDIEIEYKFSVIDFDVYEKNVLFGRVFSIIFNGSYELIEVILNDKSKFWIPLIKPFLLKIDVKKKCIYVEKVDQLREV